MVKVGDVVAVTPKTIFGTVTYTYDQQGVTVVDVNGESFSEKNYDIEVIRSGS